MYIYPDGRIKCLTVERPGNSDNMIVLLPHPQSWVSGETGHSQGYIAGLDTMGCRRQFHYRGVDGWPTRQVHYRQGEMVGLPTNVVEASSLQTGGDGRPTHRWC